MATQILTLDWRPGKPVSVELKQFFSFPRLSTAKLVSQQKPQSGRESPWNLIQR
jgi:hypothetical protein